VRLIRVTIATTATGVTSVTPSLRATILPPAGEDMRELSLTQGMPTDATSLLYWRRVFDKANPTTSAVGVAAVLLRDSASAANLRQSEIFNLSAGNWTGYGATGDYIKGASFGSSPRFLAQWTSPGGVVHTNIVDLLLP
jgi:hypothetical protein